MSTQTQPTWTAFLGHKRVAAGSLADVALAVKRAATKPRDENLFVFDDATGRVIDLDTRGSDADIVQHRSRAAKEAAYRFMSGIAGDFVNFEEATRALFAGDEDRFTGLIASWPVDVRDYAAKLAAPAFGLADADRALIKPTEGFV
jgi:hypothetical protein